MMYFIIFVVISTINVDSFLFSSEQIFPSEWLKISCKVELLFLWQITLHSSWKNIFKYCKASVYLILGGGEM